jgi:hypothetical protein
MTMRNQIITIVYDYSKNKLRAQAQDGRWVRFPNHLRVRGAKYMVDLTKSRDSWIAGSEIKKVELTSVRR